MAHHPRYQLSLDDLFLHVYVYIDDWLGPYRPQLPKHSVLAKAALGEGPVRLSYHQAASATPNLIDSKPLPVAKGKRADWAKLLGAAKGFSTMGMVYGGTRPNGPGFARSSSSFTP